MKVAIDTNVLAYAEGVDGVVRRRQAIDLLKSIPPENILLPVQVLGELFTVLVRKAKRSGNESRDAVTWWMDSFETAETSEVALRTAFSLAASHNVATWDAIILSVASERGCRLLLSEDMQDGFTWNGLTIVNPFADSPSALLKMAQAST